eukprot:scaffold3.g6366.t1
MAGARQTPVLTPEEMYFMAKDEVITIVPNFSLPTENGTMQCFSVRAQAGTLRDGRGRQGEYGPFQPNREVDVPLWLALTLWKRKSASLKPPAWMDVTHLEAVLALERQDASAFQPLPFHYIEARIAHFLFTAGTDAALPAEVFGDALARVRDLVELVQKARMNKILAGLATLQGAMTVKLNNLAAMEINTVRPFFLGALDMFLRQQRLEEAPLGGEASQPGGSRLLGSGQAAAPARQLRRGAAA